MTHLLLYASVLLVLCKFGRGDVYVALKNETTISRKFLDRESDDTKLQIQPNLDYTGLLTVPVPRNACTEVQKLPPAVDDFIALVDLTGCSVQKKVRNIVKAGYLALLVKNTEDKLLRITDKHLGIYTASVSKSTGDTLEREYLYTRGYLVILTPNFPFLDWGQYLIPFLVIIGISLVLMMIFMVAKYYRQRLRARRNRLSPKNLKKIPTKKFAEGDEYDVCAICLEDYKVGDKLRILPCDHAYHSKCVDPWLTEGKRTCPVCKRAVFVDRQNEAQTSTEESQEGSSANERTPLISTAPPLPPSTSHLVEVT